MKRLLKSVLVLAAILSISSCGLPTAAVRTARNAIQEVDSLSDGTSSAYTKVQ